ncbi:MAG TPA: hypothetical protein VNW97_22885 [Candidatus Saccharimonadales bacterium]|jgi:uncharacterized membrane protein YkoI|nr:hypothetical protein [Candidatus Saccharimonadales bacterium]
MSPNKSAILTVLAAFVIFTASVSSQEKRIKKTDLPTAVQKTADEQAKGATVRGYNKETENGKVAYEVELTVNGHSKDVTMDAQGNVLEIEEEVAPAALPPAVREALQQKAGKGTITKVESLTKKGALVAYEAQVREGKKHSEIQVGPDGKPLAHKE